MTWRALDPATRKRRFGEPEAGTIGTNGTIAPDQAPIVPIVPIVPSIETRSDALAERAAIVAEGAGVPAEWADGFAALDAMPVPRGVGEAAWRAMLDAAGRFLDAWGSRCAALGWTADELLGLDADAPMNRLDRRGAAFLIMEGEVLAVTGEAITIRMGGAVQRIYRQANHAKVASVSSEV
ncbi:MAG: hypothetical protein ACR2F8_03770 [Caulobacteraceae bacterium]